MDFTFKKYDEIMSAISNNEMPSFRILDWISEKPQTGICIRHDVDRKASNALSFARIEKDHGIRSTYYFRITSGSFNKSIISQIESLGHEVGYHYEDLALAGGDHEKARSLFGQHLGRLREVASVKTIAMHGRPLSRFDSRDLWQQVDLEEFDLVGEAFLTIDYSDVLYITDTGRSWSSSSANLRDHVQSDIGSNIASSDQLIEAIDKEVFSKVALVAHPERWEDSRSRWVTQYMRDKAINGAKLVIGMSRGALKS